MQAGFRCAHVGASAYEFGRRGKRQFGGQGHRGEVKRRGRALARLAAEQHGEGALLGVQALDQGRQGLGGLGQ